MVSVRETSARGATKGSGPDWATPCPDRTLSHMTINRSTRTRRRRILGGCVLAASLMAAGLAPSSGDPIGGGDVVSYSGDIEAVLHGHCTTCHAGDDPSGDLALTTYDAVRHQIEKGTLLARIAAAEKPMPPSGRLPLHLRRLFAKWAEGGFKREGPASAPGAKEPNAPFVPPAIAPVPMGPKAMAFLERMQGHWTGDLFLMGQHLEWFAFDYRAIAPSHVHGLFEGGTIGNLFTSFFVTNFRGTRTLMARNGGMLNGIYRTSYLVLANVADEDGEARYRFVDAYGGAKIMWLDVAFRDDRIRMEAHTSRMGLRAPTLHMRFRGTRRSRTLADVAAKAVGFPKNVIERDFAEGLPKRDWGPEHTVTSATYMAEAEGKSLVELGKLANDPYRIDQMPHVGRLQVEVARTAQTRDTKLLLLLSERPLVSEDGRLIGEGGFLDPARAETILLFPEIAKTASTFELTYLHPGTYYLTVVADLDGDSYPGPGDITHPRREVAITPKSQGRVHIRDLEIVN